jgi:hypothetical protein
VGTALDAVAGLALGIGGAWFAVVGAMALFGGGFWRTLGLMAFLVGLTGVAAGALVVWIAVALWNGAAWARWPTAALALGLVPAAVLFTVWFAQGALLVLALVGPALAICLFLPSARRHVGAATAEVPDA